MVPFVVKGTLRLLFVEGSRLSLTQRNHNRKRGSALSLEQVERLKTGQDAMKQLCACVRIAGAADCLPQQRFSFALKVEGQASGGTRLGSPVARAPSQSATSRLG